MTRHARTTLLLLILGVGCSGGGGDAATTPATTEPPAATERAGTTEPEPTTGPTVADQVAVGQKIWDESCLNCHKYGSPGSELVGPFSRSKAKTAAELHAFIKEKMPKDDPGTLSDEQAWAVLAAILSKRSQLGDAALTPETASSLALE